MTDKALARIDTSEMQEWDDERVALLKRTIAKKASNDELALFIQFCNRTGLDPFAKQVYCIHRYDKYAGGEVMNIQTSIDGFRLIAERTQKYLGQTPTQWCGKDGEWKDVWLSSDPPAAAKVGVYKKGAVEPTYRVAHYDEYVQTYRDKRTGKYKPTSMWANMPRNQLAKCAESLALRAAFPQELSGVYSDAEMAQAENEVTHGPSIRSVVDVAQVRESVPTPRGRDGDGEPTPVVAEAKGRDKGGEDNLGGREVRAVDTGAGEILDGEYTEVEDDTGATARSNGNATQVGRNPNTRQAEEAQGESDEPPLTEAQQRKILSLAKTIGMDAFALSETTRNCTSNEYESVGTLTKQAASTVIKALIEIEQEAPEEDSPEFFALVRDINKLLEHPLPEGLDELHGLPIFRIKAKDGSYKRMNAEQRLNAAKRMLHSNLLQFIESVGYDENHLNAVKKEWGEHPVWAAVEEKWGKQLAECEEIAV